METLSLAGIQLGLAMFSIEGLKKLVYKVAGGKFDIDPRWYLAIVPGVNALWALLFALLGFAGYTFPVDWLTWLQAIAQQLVISIFTVFVYNNTVQPYKASVKAFDKAN